MPLSHDARALSELIGKIYDCAVDPDLWPQALAAICRQMRAGAGTISYSHIAAGTPLVAFAPGTEPHYTRLYVDEYAHRNPLVNAINAFTIADPRRIDDLVPPEEFKASELYKGWAAPQGYEYLMASCVYRD